MSNTLNYILTNFYLNLKHITYKYLIIYTIIVENSLNSYKNMPGPDLSYICSFHLYCTILIIITYMCSLLYYYF